MINKILLLLAALAVAGCSSSGTGSVGASARGSAASSSPSTAISSAGSATPSTATSSATYSTAPPALHNFRAASITWVGNHGWALGSADCLTGPGSCDAIEHTTDGRTWTSLPAPAGAQVAMADSQTYCDAAVACLTGLRFATDLVGYAFGSGPYSSNGAQTPLAPQASLGALFTTADGGRTWHRQTGDAEAVETLNGTVIRVDYDNGLPGPFAVRVAAVGSNSWQPIALPGPVSQYGAELARAAGRSYLLGKGHTAGGAENATSTLWTSTDGGRHWTRRGEPCPQSGYREVDSTALSAAPDGSVTVLCTPRGTGRVFTATSTDGGAVFHAGSRTALGSSGAQAFGAASASTFVVCSDDAYRTTDGGQRFARIGANGASSPGPCSYVGFASTSVGHAISADERTVFTTADAGRTWSAHRFG